MHELKALNRKIQKIYQNKNFITKTQSNSEINSMRNQDFEFMDNSLNEEEDLNQTHLKHLRIYILYRKFNNCLYENYKS